MDNVTDYICQVLPYYIKDGSFPSFLTQNRETYTAPKCNCGYKIGNVFYYIFEFSHPEI